MRAFDTNVLVRILVRDDEVQSQLAADIWQEALDGDGAYFTKIVIAEAVWVLRRSYKLDRDLIFQVIQQVLDTRGVVVEDEGQVREALSEFEAGRGDLADYLILEEAKRVQALPVITFDRKFARTRGVELLAAS